ncbi:CTL-like protein 2 isoform X1 [Varroa destructor]|uniref:Choline transporter-like protein n=2 Tax=Varroa destructor TaxID=109461 RepID=A0A7M7JZA1_VARDE|nr:CTL-like protein 2 isoform X1 [Varroa destructor]XP_022659374.1 CTL-like protein 2 isoform X1 [Varroa destructor]XP_022659382.1 CTL-like protein 2 isoform X1 [Varroa destructor]
MGRHYSSSDDSCDDHCGRARRSFHRNARGRDSHHEDYRDGQRTDRRSHLNDSDDNHRPHRHYSNRNGQSRRRSPSPMEMVSVNTHHIYDDRQHLKQLNIPTKVNRSCTDITFLILFLMVIFLWSLVAFVAIKNVNLENLMPHKDSNGNLCGTRHLTNKRILYIENLEQCVTRESGKIFPTFKCTRTFCVESCPNMTSMSKESQFCTRDICTNYVLQSREFLGICIPVGNCEPSKTTEFSTASTPYPDTTREALTEVCDRLQAFSMAFYIFWDVTDAYPVILGLLGVALLIAFVWTLLMRFFASVIVWTSFYNFLIVFGGLAVFTGHKAYTLRLIDPKSDINFETLNDLNYLKSRWYIWAGISGVLGLLFLLMLVLLVFLRKRVQIAIALIKQASRAIASLPTLVVFPVFPYILQAAGLALLVALGFIIQAVHNEDNAKSTCINDFKNLDYVNNGMAASFCGVLIDFLQHTVAIQIFNVFCGTWLVLFINAFGYLVVAHAVAKYFWTHKSEEPQCMAVVSSIGVIVRYHLGTLALGSLVITILGLVKAAVEKFQHKARKVNSSSCMKTLLRCCVCCLWLLTKSLIYVNKNAYIMVAMYGKSFCYSASKTFNLIVSNILRALIVTKVTNFIIFIAKVTTTISISAITFFILHREDIRSGLELKEPKYIAAPVAAVALSSYVLISCFFNVYNNVIDTLFLCFLEDTNQNDGSRERPYRMPSELLRILGKKNYRRREKKN